MEFAWLDLFGEKWLLLDGNTNSPARSWTDKDAALAQLKEEGWIITGPHPKRLPNKRDALDRDCGYVMTRTVH